MRKLKYTELRKNYNLDSLNFKSTEELVPYNDIIGQEKAEKAFKFGISIKSNEYNLYVSGYPSTGKFTFAQKFTIEQAEKEEIPPDICYIYNFKFPKYPKAIKLPAGFGNKFANDIDDLLNILINEIPRGLANKEFENKKNDTIKEFDKKREDIIDIMSEKAEKQNFGLKTTSTGMYFMPIVDGEMLTDEQYDNLTEEEKYLISKKTEIVQKNAFNIMADIKELENEMYIKLTELEYSESLFIIGYYLDKLLEKYDKYEEVLSYLMDLKEDILENLDKFTSENEEEENIQYLLSNYDKKNKDFFDKYKVNVLVDNSNQKGAPVIVTHNPTYSALIGDIEYESEHGDYITDFLKIKAGLLHKANGGYLILQAQDILNNKYSWECLKKALITNKLEIEPLREYSTGISMNIIEPDIIDINVKVILLGTEYMYYILNSYDLEFKKIFKFKVDFDYEIDLNLNTINLISRYIKFIIDENNLKNLDVKAILKIIHEMSRMAENQNKITAEFGIIKELLLESNKLAELENLDYIDENIIDRTIKFRNQRVNLYEDKINKMLLDNSILINTSGKSIGQINVLAVIDLQDYIFAKPSKITATTYIGNAGVINIEKESNISGNIHEKGVQILSGYLGNVFAQTFNLSLSCKICFEQSYTGVDGDSASSGELYAILSRLANVPINQEIAVTGSINQYGEIQPIGGVTYKIEGFYNLCKERGLTGSQGVIIPKQNIKELVLKDDIIEDIKNKKFYIYVISSVHEGIEILTGLPFESFDKNHKLKKDCIKYKVLQTLKNYRKYAELK